MLAHTISQRRRNCRMYSIYFVKHRGYSYFFVTQYKIKRIQYLAMEIQPTSVSKTSLWSLCEVILHKSAVCCLTLLHRLL